jgi:hypothetical protein
MPPRQSVRVVDRVDRVLGSFERVLAEGDHRLGLAVAEQVPHRADDLVDAGRVVVGLPVGDVAVGLEGVVDRVEEGPKRRRAGDRLRCFKAEPSQRQLVGRGQLEHEVDEPLVAEALEVGTHVDVRLDVVLLLGGAGLGGDQGERDGVLAEAPLNTDRAGTGEHRLTVPRPRGAPCRVPIPGRSPQRTSR